MGGEMTKRKKSKKSKMKEKAWSWFSKYRRLLFTKPDGTCTCVTCGIVKDWKEMHAGHYVDGRNNSVLFDEELVYPQCFHCNSKRWGCLAGNKIKYTIFLLRQGYSAEQLDAFDNLKFETKKYTEEDFEDIKNKYKIKAEELLEKIEGGEDGIHM
jgi:hypothetical protein